MSQRGANIIPFTAGASISPNTTVKIGSADNAVIPAAAATDQPVGVSVMTVAAFMVVAVSYVTVMDVSSTSTLRMLG